ncbi:MAG TPA: ABC transporter ATP-binding protein [Actinomycetota bacterium]|nr:ABC transporter ATP-binding protein [Actinomycetota bacterium]
MSASAAGPAIQVRNLAKRYGEIEAVRGIDLSVERGEVFALLGPNGAGKTSTVEILEGHRRRSGGEVDVLGFDPARGGRAFRSRIGVVLQQTGVEKYLTVAEVIELFRGYYPAPLPLDEIIDVVGLREKRDERVRRLSGGQQRRLDVAVGLAGNPDLLFLDEPTTGFDPGARRNAWDMIRNLKALGKTIFLTTHYMDEAQELADRVAVIAGGRIVAEGSPDQIGGRDTAETLIRFRTPARPLPKAVAAGASVHGDTTAIGTATPTKTLAALTAWAVRNSIELEDLQVTRPTLEDVYLRLAGAQGE